MLCCAALRSLVSMSLLAIDPPQPSIRGCFGVAVLDCLERGKIPGYFAISVGECGGWERRVAPRISGQLGIARVAD